MSGNMARFASLFAALFILGIMICSLTSCSQDNTDNGDAPAGKPQAGGVLKIAYGANPATLDVQAGNGQAIRDVGEHIAEYLYDLDSKFVPRAGLAEEHSVSEDGLSYIVSLRKGVKFHNGKEMTSEDVVASTKRYLDVRPTIPEWARTLESVSAVDEHTVEFRFTRPMLDFSYIIGSQSHLVIYPKEICEKYLHKEIPDNEIVGTGPYKLKERTHDRFVHLVRFEEFSSRSEEPDGWTGKKHAYADEIILYIVPDQAVRLMGVETGDYHYAHGINYSEYERVKNHSAMAPFIAAPFANLGSAVNCSLPPMDNIKVRLAAQAALNVREIMEAAYTFSDLYSLDSSYMPRPLPWYSEKGDEYFNQGNTEKAAQLLKEAGYDGTPIVLIGMTEYDFLKNGALIMKHQLEKAGFRVDLKLSDQGTFVARLYSKPEWHLALLTSAFVPVPTMLTWTSEEHVGWWVDARKRQFDELIRTEADYEKRLKIWEDYQEYSYSQGVRIRFGSARSVAAVDRRTGGWINMPEPRFWNVWVKSR